jgi:hypothetical protein
MFWLLFSALPRLTRVRCASNRLSSSPFRGCLELSGLRKVRELRYCTILYYVLVDEYLHQGRRMVCIVCATL